MSVFEYVLALYAIVAGLGVSLLVRSVGQMIEARDSLRLYWVHTCWLAVVFVSHVVSWFVLWRFKTHSPWTILQALLLLSTPILLYLVSHLAVPELGYEREHDMRAYYYRHARWSQALLFAALVVGVFAQLLIEARLDLSGARGVRAALLLVLLPGILSNQPKLHGVQAILLLVVMAIAVMFVASPIG